MFHQAAYHIVPQIRHAESLACCHRHNCDTRWLITRQNSVPGLKGFYSMVLNPQLSAFFLMLNKTFFTGRTYWKNWVSPEAKTEAGHYAQCREDVAWSPEGASRSGSPAAVPCTGSIHRWGGRQTRSCGVSPQLALRLIYSLCTCGEPVWWCPVCPGRGHGGQVSGSGRLQ